MAGCSVVSNLPAPGKALYMQDPAYNRPYHLYIPTRYTGQQRWPLVVACHGTIPFDTAKLQFDEWKGLAEQKGFLLAAPELVGTSGFTPKTEKQIRLQEEDEKAILSIVRSIRAARSVDDTRIFLFGWSAGSYAVMYTGLRHPDIFRALSVRQGNFNPEFVEPCIPFLDRYQPIQIMYGDLDPIDNAQVCIEWLRKHGFSPTTIERAGTHKRDQMPVYSFFTDVIRKRPWLRIKVKDDPVDPMKVAFSAKTSFEPVRYLWDFGDGSSRSPIASPEHKYEKPGTYTVKVGIWGSNGGPKVRSIQLQMPRIRLGVVGQEPSESSLFRKD